MLLLSQSVLNIDHFNEEKFDFIRAFDYNLTPNLTETHEKMSLFLFLKVNVYLYVAVKGKERKGKRLEKDI